MMFATLSLRPLRSVASLGGFGCLTVFRCWRGWGIYVFFAATMTGPAIALRERFAVPAGCARSAAIPTRRLRSACSNGPRGPRVLQAVVAAEFAAIALVRMALLVVLGGVLDLFLRAVHMDDLGFVVDAFNHARRQHHGSAQDPRSRRNDQVGAACLGVRFVNPSDVPISGFDGETDDI